MHATVRGTRLRKSNVIGAALALATVALPDLAGADVPAGSANPPVEPPSAARTMGAAEFDAGSRRRSRVSPTLRSYLTRDLAFSARHLDHGVLSAGVAGGWPHRYRLELGLGLLDHLTVGITAHWLPRQPAPRWSPKVALAFYRWRRLEIGAHYFRSLYPAPDSDGPAFDSRADWFLSAVSFSQMWLSAGFDAGVVRGIERDPAQPPAEDGPQPVIARWRFGGGAHLRAGTRRWGFTANVLVPHLYAELVFDVRFGLFEARPKGGWRPTGILWSTDRRVPAW
jgi:hypothetical protein